MSKGKKMYVKIQQEHSINQKTKNYKPVRFINLVWLSKETAQLSKSIRNNKLQQFMCPCNKRNMSRIWQGE